MKSRILRKLEESAVGAAPRIYATIQADLLEGLRDLDAVILGLFTKLIEASTVQANTVAQNAAIDIADSKTEPALKELLESIPASLQ